MYDLCAIAAIGLQHALSQLLLAQALEAQSPRQLVSNEHAQMLRRQLHEEVLQMGRALIKIQHIIN